MDSQRFVQILQETVRSQNHIMYTLCSYIQEAKTLGSQSFSLSSLRELQRENEKLKEEITKLKTKLL